MPDNTKVQRAIATIISGTRRVKRPIDLMTLVDSISCAEEHMGGIEPVAKVVGLSVQQLRDFLAVKKLSSEVRAMVRRRAIDSVDVVKNISQLAEPKQRILAREFTKGTLSSKDVRIITTFAKRFPQRTMARMLRDYHESRDKRTYILELPVLTGHAQLELRESLERILGKRDIVSVRTGDKGTIVEISPEGHIQLRDAVRRGRTTLRRFIGSMLEEVRRQE